MARPANQPAASDFRHGSTDRSVILMIEGCQSYGLITHWSRVVGEDEKPTYTVVFPDGDMETNLRPQEAKWLLQGMVNAHRLHTRGLVVDIKQRKA